VAHAIDSAGRPLAYQRDDAERWKSSSASGHFFIIGLPTPRLLFIIVIFNTISSSKHDPFLRSSWRRRTRTPRALTIPSSRDEAGCGGINTSRTYIFALGWGLINPNVRCRCEQMPIHPHQLPHECAAYP
jgi:hypothetical protein